MKNKKSIKGVVKNITLLLDSLNKIIEAVGVRGLNEVLPDIHAMTWNKIVYGASFLGVIYGSILSLVAPFFEEIIISGLFANYICKKKNVIYALTITPVCFSLLHIPAFGIGGIF